MKTKSLLFLLAFTILSCESQLDTVPTDFASSATYYSNEDQLNKGLTAVYDLLGHASLYGEQLLTYMSYTNDEAVFRHPTDIAYSNFSYASSAPKIANLWNALYRGIRNANILLEALDHPNASGVSQSVKDNMRAQALFLRAYYFFMLVDRWGAVPMPLSTVKSASDVNMTPTPVAEAYAQIVSDMTEAEVVLPQASELGANSSGRISKNTAQGILARVCLSMAGFPLNDASKYAEALAWCTKVIETGENSLNPSYADLFVKQARDEYDIQENMWEVEFYGNYQDNYREGGYVGVRNGLYAVWGLDYPGYGYDYLRVSKALWDKYQYSLLDPAKDFLAKDLRMARNIAPYYWSGGSSEDQNMIKVYQPQSGASNRYTRWPAKWRREEEINLPRFKNGNGTNFPLLRYADVLLMFAEAENEVNNGPTQAAYDAINQVRRRAWGTGYRVKSLRRTSAGSGYKQAPLITFSQNGDNGASAAEAYPGIISSGDGYYTIASAINLVNPGAFYDATPPTVTITSVDGYGSGATATATVELINPEEADLETGLSKEEFFQEIKDERARELAFECLRSHDLRRWGILIPTIKELGSKYGSAAPASVKNYYLLPAANITTRHLYYPIPPSEMVNNALMVQNPGW
ncbi:MAG: RagB/SusD family nutrient uptake outer membrane protein [Mangrovibacterium sp.]